MRRISIVLGLTISLNNAAPYLTKTERNQVVQFFRGHFLPLVLTKHQNIMMLRKKSTYFALLMKKALLLLFRPVSREKRATSFFL